MVRTSTDWNQFTLAENTQPSPQQHKSRGSIVLSAQQDEVSNSDYLNDSVMDDKIAVQSSVAPPRLLGNSQVRTARRPASRIEIVRERAGNKDPLLNSDQPKE